MSVHAEAERPTNKQTLYILIMCFATNCLSSIALEAGSFHFTSSTRGSSAIFNNLFRQKHKLRIKIMMTDVLTALVSTAMLTIGDFYEIPYLYLPWLVDTIEGLAFCEAPAIFGFAYTVLPDANVFAGTFIFFTFLFYVEELIIWKDVFVRFKRCWINYNKINKMTSTSTNMANKESGNKENLNEQSSRKLEDLQDSAAPANVNSDCYFCEPALKVIKNNLSIKHHRSKSLFTETTG
ncbi:uncharacterized protein LOC109855711 isoform X2 [Pseudomyrmex gracilis]|uniref:uncharacterized protein LOC109855711 isoform X2 n=1 Tax=Pseudomyrmex gracilis TaxID=219809 RepID=UPI000995274B|nr:uncharacterized protein LOC109855711 isoform X2 [Pseudomyrmex gracilis]XP_020285825.1 uncharacterized protein LOC109855711 isoform X2 [Pseudomyrmex gracilis]